MAHKPGGGVRRAEPKLGYEYDYAKSEAQAADLLGKLFRQKKGRYPPVIGIDLEFDSHDAERPISLVQVSNEHNSVAVLDEIEIAGGERNTRKVFGLQYAKRGGKKAALSGECFSRVRLWLSHTEHYTTVQYSPSKEL